MPNFRRYYLKGGTYFFTVVTFNRHPILKETTDINLLQQCFEIVNESLPFRIDALVILPDHLHTIWTLPDNDYDFSTRWKRIKAAFSKKVKDKTPLLLPESLALKKEKGIWQRRFWEHLIRDQEDFDKHCDYIHYNPVKHGLVKAPIEWKYSSFDQFVKRGFYENDWGKSLDRNIIHMDLE